MISINLEQPKYEKYFQQLKKAHFEYEGSKSIIIYMIINNMTNNDNYKNYWEEYLKYLIEYENIKNIFQEQVVLKEVEDKNVKHQWEIDFQKRVVNIE